jgi:hypothetical protein
VGFSPSRIRGLFLAEALVLSLAGGLLGVLAALGYAAFILTGLGAWWVDAVGTRDLRLTYRLSPLIAGAGGGMIASLLATLATLRMLGRYSPKRLLSGGSTHSVKFQSRGYWYGGVFAAAAGTLAIAGVRGGIPAAGAFFGAGTCALAAALSAFRGALGASIGRLLDGNGGAAMRRLAFRNAAFRPGRTVLPAALIASATFLLVSLETFRKGDMSVQDAKSGSGGFALVGETIRPVYFDPNREEGKAQLNLDAIEGVRFEPMRLRPGEDASCLNLYRPSNPRILGAGAGLLRSGRFSFAASLASSDAEKANPWLLLEGESGDGSIPAAADANSMMYVLHKKLGEEVVVEGDRGRVRLRLVAALQDSVFQGELIIGEKAFLREFPSQQGYRVFLMEAAAPERVAGQIEESLGDFGMDVQTASAKLAGFHRIENTYLSTFQTLGGLGLLLGTIGLAAVLARNVLERRRELALLSAVGYAPGTLTKLVLTENLMLLSAGLLSGVAAAGIGIAPVVASRGMSASLLSITSLLAAVGVTGAAAAAGATWAVMRERLLMGLRAG